MVYIYPATIQHEDDGRVSIWFEDLPGCATFGNTLAEAITMARDAMGGWLDVALSDGLSIPSPRSARDLPLEGNQESALIDIDLDAYRRDNDIRSISRTVTLPAWLNSRAQKAGMNFSAILQAALKRELRITEA